MSVVNPELELKNFISAYLNISFSAKYSLIYPFVVPIVDSFHPLEMFAMNDCSVVGVRFQPTDEDLLDSYLRMKAVGGSAPYLSFIPRLDIYAQPPWVASKMIGFSRFAIENEFYCFCSVKKSVSKDNRLQRKTPGGYWSAKGHVKNYQMSDGRALGTMTPLKFFLDDGRGGAKKRKLNESNTGTVWVMNEFRLPSSFWSSALLNGTHELVLCKISPSGTGVYDDGHSGNDSASKIQSRKRLRVKDTSNFSIPHRTDSQENAALEMSPLPTVNYHQESHELCADDHPVHISADSGVNVVLEHHKEDIYLNTAVDEADVEHEFNSLCKSTYQELVCSSANISSEVTTNQDSAALQNYSAPLTDVPTDMDDQFWKMPASTDQEVVGLSYESTSCCNGKDIVHDSALLDDIATALFDDFDFSIDIQEMEKTMQNEFSSLIEQEVDQWVGNDFASQKDSAWWYPLP